MPARSAEHPFSKESPPQLLNLLSSACLGEAEALTPLPALLKLLARDVLNLSALAAGDAAAHGDPSSRASGHDKKWAGRSRGSAKAGVRR